MICDELPVRPGKLFVSIRSLFKAYVVALMSSAKIYYDWYKSGASDTDLTPIYRDRL